MTELTRRRRALFVGGKAVIVRGQCGENAFCTLYKDGTLKIYGTGTDWNGIGGRPVPWDEYKEEIIEVIIEEGITGFEWNFSKGQFENCTNLEKVTFPTTFNLLNSTRTFYNCPSLQSIILPEGISQIRDYCFYNCSSLQSVIIPNGVTNIGASAFLRCASLQSVIIPASVTKIESAAFQMCSNLVDVVLENGLTIIGASMFRDCAGLRSVTIPASVTSVGNDAIRHCINLERVYFLGTPGETMHPYLLYENNKLTDVYVPWSEEEVANAPWGANRATIHYNTTYDTNGNPIV